MPYNANIPQSTDLLSASQPQILGNFTAIQTLIDVDHVDFASMDQGKHFRVSLPVQSPAPTFDAGNVGLYSFQNSRTSQNELYINKVNQITVTQIPATASILSTTSSPTPNSSGWTYLPSGILIKWGSATVTSTSGSPVQTVTFPAGANIPVFSSIFSMQITTSTSGTVDNNKYVILQSFALGGTTFAVIAVARSSLSTTYVQATFQYLAIGIGA